MRLVSGADLRADFFAQPFPLEARRGADGRYDLAGFPNPLGYEVLEFIKGEVQKDMLGYGTNAAAYLTFSGPLDFSAAVTGAQAQLTNEAAVLLVNVDEKSPAYKKVTPAFVKFFRGDSRYLPVNTLAVAPIPGFPLRGDTLYAVVVLADYGLQGLEGPLRQSAELGRALAGTGAFGATYAPLAKTLDALGIAPGKVVGATVYRTVDFAGPLFKARDWLYAEGLTGSARVTGRVSGTETRTDDEHFDHIVSCTATYRHVHGTFKSVIFQHGDPFTAGQGGFVLDAQGRPIPDHTEELRFALSLPEGAPPAGGWPLVIYAHGTGGDYHTGISIKEPLDTKTVHPCYAPKDEGTKLAEKGIALVSYDQPYHGPRNTRVADCTGTCPQLYTFNFLNPPAARDGFRQSALDAVQLLRATLALQFDWGGTLHHFDADRVYYMGHSQGSTSGPMFVAAEDRVKAAVFSGPAGGLTLTFLYKTEPVPIPSLVGFFFGDLEGFDLFQPVVNLFQAYLEPVDPMNYARLVAQEPRQRDLVRSVLVTEGLEDLYTPPVQAEAFAIALGVPPVKPEYQDLLGFGLAGLAPVAPGFSNNLTNVNGERWTGGLLQFPDTGHFSIYCQTAANTAFADFLETAAAGAPAIADYGAREWKYADPSLDLFCSQATAQASPRAAP